MATATYSNGVFLGGTATDRITLTKLAEAASSPLTKVLDNLAEQTTAGRLVMALSTTSFSDLTGGKLILKNTANNQELRLKLQGDVRIGAAGQLVEQPFELNIGEKDLRNTHTVPVELFDTNAKLVMESPFVFKFPLDQRNSTAPAEPAARNVIRLTNSNSSSKINFKFLGAPFTKDADYTLPNAVSYKPNGTCIIEYGIANTVPNVKLEVFDGYIDIRCVGTTWKPFKEANFVSSTWQKWTADVEDTVKVFGDANKTFKVKLGTASSYFLHAMFNNKVGSTASAKVVYLNFSGLSWATQLAAFGANKAVKLENHLTLDYKFIDALGTAISGAKIVLTKRDPVYNADSEATATVSFPTDTTIESIADVQGEGVLGVINGSTDNAICVEAFRRASGGGGNVDGAYANTLHAKGAYANHTALKYSVFKFGKEIVFEATFNAQISGVTGGGKQEIGTVQLSTQTNLTASTSSAVPTSATSLDDIFDMLYKHSIDNKNNQIGSVSTGVYTITGNLILSTTATTPVSINGSDITIKCNPTLVTGKKIFSLKATGDISFTGVSTNNLTLEATNVNVNTVTDITGAKITGNLVFNSNTDKSITFTNATITLLKNNGTGIISVLQVNSKITNTSDAQIRPQVQLSVPHLADTFFYLRADGNNPPTVEINGATGESIIAAGTKVFTIPINSNYELYMHSKGKKPELFKGSVTTSSIAITPVNEILTGYDASLNILPKIANLTVTFNDNSTAIRTDDRYTIDVVAASGIGNPSNREWTAMIDILYNSVNYAKTTFSYDNPNFISVDASGNIITLNIPVFFKIAADASTIVWNAYFDDTAARKINPSYNPTPNASPTNKARVVLSNLNRKPSEAELGASSLGSIISGVNKASNITDIKTKTDQLNFTGDDLKVTLDGEQVSTDSASRTDTAKAVWSTDISAVTTGAAKDLKDAKDQAIIGANNTQKD